jgi:hypothetical protein
MKTEPAFEQSWWDVQWNKLIQPLRWLSTRPWSCLALLVLPVALCLISLTLMQGINKDKIRGTATMQTAIAEVEQTSTGAAIQTATIAAMETSTALGTPPVTSTPSIEPRLDLTLTAAP